MRLVAVSLALVLSFVFNNVEAQSLRALQSAQGLANGRGIGLQDVDGDNGNGGWYDRENKEDGCNENGGWYDS